MTTAYTSLLGLALPVTGELSGTWGDTVNNSITSLLDTSVAGTTNVSTDADVTLTTTTGAANTARQAILLFSGARTAQRTVTAPAQSKVYTVINATTGGYAVKLVGAGPTTGLTIPNGASATVAWNGSDFALVSTLSSAGVVPTTNGGTGLTSFTANGVVYASSSSALATGSALTFDGQYVSIGTGASSPNGIKFLANGGGLSANLAVNHSTGEIQNFATTNYFPTWYANNAERMRLDTSGNLGIGTTSPASKLHLSSSASTAQTITSVGTAAYASVSFVNTTTGYGYDIGFGGSTSVAPNSFYVYGGSSASVKMQIDSTGNLGLGTTPANWGTGVAAIQVAGYYAAFGSNVTGAVQTFMVSNAYYNGGWRGGLTGSNSTCYEQFGGQHRWYVASSVTAGSLFSYTQAMTMDVSGNLIVADTAQQYSARLYVSGSIAARNGGVDGTYADAFVAGYTGNYNERNIIQTQVGGNSGFRFNCSDGGGSSGTTTSMTVTKAGVVVSSNYVWQATDGSGKGFLLGSSGSANGLISQTSGGSGSTATYIGNAQIIATSDVRLKENIVDSQRNALEIIDKIRIVDFTWNDPTDQSLNNKASRGVWTGLIAQEAVAHIPWLINKPTEDTENGKPVYWNADYGHAVPFLMKAIQEQQAIIESLKARLDAANL